MTRESSRFSLKVDSHATPLFSVIFVFLRNHIFPPENDHTIKQHQQSLLQEARKMTVIYLKTEIVLPF